MANRIASRGFSDLINGSFAKLIGRVTAGYAASSGKWLNGPEFIVLYRAETAGRAFDSVPGEINCVTEREEDRERIVKRSPGYYGVVNDRFHC